VGPVRGVGAVEEEDVTMPSETYAAYAASLRAIDTKAAEKAADDRRYGGLAPEPPELTEAEEEKEARLYAHDLPEVIVSRPAEPRFRKYFAGQKCESDLKAITHVRGPISLTVQRSDA
jgi:hypothetical protein